VTDEQPPEKSKRSRRIYVYWGVALALLLALGLVCWKVVVPVWQTRKAVTLYGRWYYYSPHFESKHWPADPGEIIKLLDGPKAAAERLGLYMTLPECLAPNRTMAVRLLGECREDAAPVLRRLLNDEDSSVRQAAAEALKKIRAAKKKDAPK